MFAEAWEMVSGSAADAMALISVPTANNRLDSWPSEYRQFVFQVRDHRIPTKRQEKMLLCTSDLTNKSLASSIRRYLATWKATDEQVAAMQAALVVNQLARNIG